jgi:hypothetical protein
MQGMPCCAAAAQLLSVGGHQATGLLALLQQQPLLRDSCATMVATVGAVALVKVFEALTSKGVVDQARLSRPPLPDTPPIASPWHMLHLGGPSCVSTTPTHDCTRLARALDAGKGQCFCVR